MKPLLLISMLVVALVGAAGSFLTQRWFPTSGVAVVWVSAALNLIACWVSFVPIALVHGKRDDYLPQAALGGMTLRLLIAAFGLLALMAFGPWESFALSIWTLVFYLSLLVVETLLTVRLLRDWSVSGDRCGGETTGGEASC